MTSSATQDRIGFIGLGVMGSAMVSNLLARGFKATVYNRSSDKAQKVAALGAEVAGSPAELSENCSALLLCLTNGTAVREVLFGTQGAAKNLKAGSVIIDLSTIAPSEAREIARELSTRSIQFLDAPVTGGDVGAKNATLTIMVGGNEATLERCRGILSAIGKKIIFMGTSGSGQLTKCVNQIAVGLGIAAMTEALSFAEKSGLDLQRVLTAISSGAAGSWAMDNYAPRVLNEDLKPGFHAVNMLKDLSFILTESKSIDADLPVTKLVTKLFTELVEKHGRELGNHALIKMYR